MKRKVLSIFLCFVMILTVIPMTAFADDESTRTVCASGTCGAQGDNLTWTLYDDGELVISGEGEMAFYHTTEKGLAESSPLVPPWYDYFGDIRVITVEEGVTGIGNEAFKSYPRQYYRVNLPKSLEYYYFGAFSSTHADGSALACSYAGTEAEWNKVEKRSLSGYRLNEEHTEVIELEHRNPTYGRGISDNASDDTYYNGEDPEIYCRIVKHDSGSKLEKNETAEFHIRYYPGEHTGAKLEWKTEGDGCAIEYTEHSASGIPTEAQIVSVTHGDFSVFAEIVAPDGTVLCSCSEDFISYVREDMTLIEKAEEFFKEIFGIGATYLYMFNLIAFLIGMSFWG